MTHISIAILKKHSSTSTNENPRFEYLVSKDKNDKLKFFEQKRNGIGIHFDHSDFENHILNYFDLLNTNREEKRTKLSKFKTNKRDPYATACEYIFSTKELEYVDNKRETDKSKNWIWESEEQLTSEETQWDDNHKFVFNKETPFENPLFTNETRASLTNISTARNNGKLVIFAGAGISIDSEVPDWKELINALRSDLDTQEGDDLDIAQLYFDTRSKKEYIEKIQKVLKHGKTRFNILHEKIAELKPLHIITTNYDTHFEQVLNEKKHGYSIVKKDNDLPYSKGPSMLIKMHGDFDEKNIVLKADDYDTAYSNNFPLIESFIKGIFASKTVLFVGFSFSDPNVSKIAQLVKDVLQDESQPPYLLDIPREEMDKRELEESIKKKNALEEKGVKVIEYEEKPFEDYTGPFISDKEKKEKNKLTLTGQKVYNFLKTVEEFDPFSDSFENLEIEKQLISSVLRFEGLGAIPTKVIEKISPFRLKKDSTSGVGKNASYSSTYPFHLETSNEELLSFLKSRNSEDANNKEIKIGFTDNLNTSLPIHEQKFNRTLSLLYSSGIKHIIGGKDINPVSIKLNPISNADEECTCSDCQYYRFEYSSLLQTLNIASTRLICKKSQQSIGLIDAYGFLKTGQVVKAYYALEELKTNSWQQEEYATYFLAIYNQSMLGRFISIINDEASGEDEIQDIQEEIENIDLNKTIFELPIDKYVKQALILIKDNNSYYSAQATIKDRHSDIVDNYNNYQKNGFRSSGPNYWYIVETTFAQLWEFYSHNHLFNDEHGYFVDLAHQYIEAMIISFCTSKRYEQRLPHLSTFFRHIFIAYGQANKLKGLFDQYNLENLSFENQEEANKEIKKIIASFNTFCSSGFQINSFLGETINQNHWYQNAILNSTLFEKKVKRVFNNFLLLMSKLDLSKEQVNNVIDDAINYLTTNPIFGMSGSLNHFTNFVTHFMKEISEENRLKLVDYILSENIWSSNLIKPICDSIVQKQNRIDFLDQTIYNKLIRRLEQKKWRIEIEDMAPIYPLLKEEQKALFYKEIRPLLTDTMTLSKAYSSNVWNPKKDRKILDDFLEKLLEECKGVENFQVDNDGFPKVADFSSSNKLHFIVALIYKHDLFEDKFVAKVHSSVKSNMFKWVLKPTDFDYSLFEMNWILFFKDKSIRASLKNIDKVKESISIGLQENYNEAIAKIYFEELMS